jgi:hypothetical protein
MFRPTRGFEFSHYQFYENFLSQGKIVFHPVLSGGIEPRAVKKCLHTTCNITKDAYMETYWTIVLLV